MKCNLMMNQFNKNNKTKNKMLIIKKFKLTIMS